MRARIRRIRRVIVLLTVLLLTLHPARTPYYRAILWLGDERAARLERTAAAEAYRQAAALRPTDPVPYLRLARLYLDWGRLNDCYIAIYAAICREADEVSSGRLQMETALARADWRAVVKQGERLLALSRADEDEEDVLLVHHALGRAYIELHKWPAAVGEYLALVQTAPDDTAAQEMLGLLLLPTDPAAAAVHLRAAGSDRAARFLELSTKGDDPAYRSALTGRALCEEGEWALAVLHLEHALALWPNYADAHAYLGYALTKSGFTARAFSHLEQAVALMPQSVLARVLLGMYHEQQGDLDAARAEYEIAYDLDPSNPATCVSLGRVWAASGRYLVAEIWFQEAVTLQPDDPELWRVLAHFYLDNDFDVEGRGVEAMERLLALSPDDAEAHDLRGWAAFLTGEYGPAEEHLRRAIELEPGLAIAHYHLGILLASQGEREAAREEFIRASDLDTTGTVRSLAERYLERP